MKKNRSHLANGAMACAVLYFAWDLSRTDRGWIDWAVLSLVGLAIVWNVFRLGQVLYRAGGGRDLWHLQRTLLFWVLGLLNTVFARVEASVGWRFVLGCALLIVAAIDSAFLLRKEKAATRMPIGDGTGPA